VIELKDHNITGGNVFLFFAGFFMLAAGLSTLSKFFMIKFGMKPAVLVEGWMWLAGASFATVVTPAYAKSNLFMFILVAVLTIGLWMIVGIDTGWYGDPVILKQIVGWICVFAGFMGIYLSGAVVCNTVYGKPIFYIPKPLVK
jgi:hypothetical protein